MVLGWNAWRSVVPDAGCFSEELSVEELSGRDRGRAYIQAHQGSSDPRKAVGSEATWPLRPDPHLGSVARSHVRTPGRRMEGTSRSPAFYPGPDGSQRKRGEQPWSLTIPRRI